MLTVPFAINIKRFTPRRRPENSLFNMVQITGFIGKTDDALGKGNMPCLIVDEITCPNIAKLMGNFSMTQYLPNATANQIKLNGKAMLDRAGVVTQTVKHFFNAFVELNLFAPIG